ncbi:acyltransferase family protein [Luteibacter sahnii]|uniref:acyltransferase family protein n=1 Tax=Luteibacter sahnii TaxID=3021977 RepID=UPI002A6B7E6A|nr:heparan-alpha-glucosaminide N-acetyltransferase domain-containing protein [Luteibacter sp. PPL193]MDY1549133.1 heparan-alpha-glucosaminide N-acetyltransferase domain-containing protein [Luteibacter sp. PPL193]
MSHATTRYASVDALRGITVAAMLLVNDPGDWSHVWPLLEHAEWNGCTFADLVFPLFLFIVGVSVSLAIVSRVEAGAPRAPLQRATIRRALRIVGLGLALNLLAWLTIPGAHFRIPGVLQRIGLCFAVAGTLAIHVRPRTRDLLGVGLLVVYGGLLLMDGMAPWSNLPSRVDAFVFGGTAYQFDPLTGRGHDPEGLLSTLPALATVLMGMRAGAWLARGQVRRLWVGALVLLVAGGLAQGLWPFNKNLWTPSYALWTGGWSFALLALAHTLVDRRGWPPFGRAFGVNAIAAYAGSGLMVCLMIALGAWGALYRVAFASWMTPLFGPYVPSAAWGVAFVAVWWGVVRWMDRRRIYLKV